MRALTLSQPYATLIALGAKNVETRSWVTRYRGPLAIHAGAGFAPLGGLRGYLALLAREPFRSALAVSGLPDYARFRHGLPLGAVLAVVELADVIATDEMIHQIGEPERSFGNYAPGRFAWLLRDVQPLKTPLTARGRLGLWQWDEPN